MTEKTGCKYCDEPGYHPCPSVSPEVEIEGFGKMSGLMCIRPRGHDGPHVACAHKHEITKWEDNAGAMK